MKRKLICLLLLCTMLLTAVSVTACSKPTPEDGTMTRMTVDINPSVEFMVDDQNKVISVTALNDDGSILIVGESFIGKTPEEAVELMVTLASDTGYLVQGNVEAEENTVKISVSGDTKYAEKLKKAVSEKAESVMESLNIAGNVQQVQALAADALRQLALSTSLYTAEEISAMDEKQLYQVIAEGRVETALLLTEEMREAYYSAKEYEISFAESEQVAKIIEDMGGLYALTHTAYTTALDLYSTAIEELDTRRYDLLISPESAYQQSLTALREAKVELLKQKSYTASLDINGTEYASATVTLQASEESYNQALAAYEALGTQINTTLETLITNLKSAKTALTELESTLFDANIKQKLQEQATQIENNLNTAKNNFFAAFESAHAEDITAIEQSLLAKKQQLKSEIKPEQ